MAENYLWRRSLKSPPSLKLLASISICRNKRLLDYTQRYLSSTGGYEYPKSLRLHLRQMRYVRLAELQMPVLNELLHLFRDEYFTIIAGGYATYQIGWSREYSDVDLYVCVPAEKFDIGIGQIVNQSLAILQTIHPELEIETVMTYANIPKMRIIRIRDEVERARDIFGHRFSHKKAFDVVFLRTTVNLTDDFYTLSQKVVKHFDLQIVKSVGLPIYMAEDKSGILFFPLQYSEEFIYDYEFVECTRLCKIPGFSALISEVYMDQRISELKILQNILSSLDFVDEALISTYRICALLIRWRKYNQRIKSTFRLLSCDEFHSTLATNAFLRRELMRWR